MHQIATTERRGIPTAINIDHYGYVVPNLDQAVAFFIDVLGFELLSIDETGQVLRQVLGVPLNGSPFRSGD